MRAVWGAEEEKSVPGQLSAIGSAKAICWHGMLPSYDERWRRELWKLTLHAT